jgi:hypothetical protein
MNSLRSVHLFYGTILLTHLANVTQINYLVKARNDKMKLIEGDSETFNDVLSLIDDYEGKLWMFF